MAIRKLGIDGHIAAINSFSGHDSMEFDDAVSLLNAMHDWYDEVFVGQLAGDVDRPRLLHETHRGRLLYSPWVTRRLLDAVPRLNLVADLSHWTCVAEFPLGPSPLAVDRDSLHRNLLAETIREIVPRIYHVQGRVGYEQGPQVDDPRQPEWAPQLSSFEYWWDLIFTNLIQKDQMCSFTAEHGPPPYQRSLPNRSHRDLLEHVDDVNQWIGARQAQRFIAISASIAAPK
uniref:Xylose isomerase-like TIM barrel domain-containing protein n=1 Tax=Spongospora subterranea TaxID=70186 RepID=A0A0H5QK12_9EUKA|eukprot:CRZ02333.1 hypothetical protein [Spongospora subterranea]